MTTSASPSLPVKPCYLLPDETTLAAVARCLGQGKQAAVGIAVNGALRGIVTPQIVAELIGNGAAPQAKMADLPLRLGLSLSTDISASQAATLMRRAQCGCVPVLDADGGLIGVVSENDLVWSAEGGSASDQLEVDQYVAFVAHDIRSPIAMILMALDLMDVPERPPSRETTLLQRIQNAARRALRISDGLVEAARYSLGLFVDADATMVNVRSLLQMLADDCQAVAEQYRVTITIAPCNAGSFPMEQQVISRAVINLLENACKYGKVGGTVTLSAQTCELPTGTWLQIAVRNQGEPITRDKLERIYSPFVRLRPSQSIGGIGLGLTIAKRFAELHGGHLRLDEAAAPDTCFVLSIPMTHKEAGAPRHEPERASRRSDSMPH